MILTPRLRLRPLVQDDFESLFAMFNDPRVMKFYPALKSREETQGWLDWNDRAWAEHKTGFFTIERLEDRTFIGQCGPLPQQIDDRFDYEVGYMLASEHWGHGYATEAARAARDWAFTTFDPDRVVSFILPANHRSIAVAQRNDMRLLKRRYVGRWKREIVIYGIMRKEWLSL